MSAKVIQWPGYSGEIQPNLKQVSQEHQMNLGQIELPQVLHPRLEGQVWAKSPLPSLSLMPLGLKPAKEVTQRPDLGQWQERVRVMVKPRRYEHVCRVAELAYQIALNNQLGQLAANQVYAAGILHDIARDLPDSELLRLAPPECDIDRQHPLALHGRAARTLLERWGYRDLTVLEAIEDHTTGPRGAHPISACVYIADVSEPGRGVNADIRELALTDLGAALNRAIISKVTYLQGRGIPVHPRTLQSYAQLSAAPQTDMTGPLPSTPLASASLTNRAAQISQVSPARSILLQQATD